jgi:hypothetical protein
MVLVTPEISRLVNEMLNLFVKGLQHCVPGESKGENFLRDRKWLRLRLL